MAAIYSVYASPTHPPLPNHLPTLIVTPHGNFPSLFIPLHPLIIAFFQVNLLISFIPISIQTLYVFLNLSLLILIPPQNTENYLLTPSPQGDLCVAKLFPPRANNPAGKPSASDPGHGSGHGGSSSRVVRCEASRNLKWSITNTGVISPIYKLALPSPDSPDLPLFQISKPNPNAAFWSMFYFAYAGHNIPPKRIEFGKIQKNPPGPNGGGTRITISGKTPEEKAVWQTLGEGNEDCVEWVVLCAALNLLE
jgi:neural Wiskott-Aldrich syndrome protein